MRNLEHLDQAVLKLAPISSFPSYFPLSKMVYESLKQAIISGSLESGQSLSENMIASQLRVSRTPVREALRLLEQENLITTLPGRKLIVAVPSIEDIQDIYGIRLIVETAALRRIQPDQTDILDQLDECIYKAERHLAQDDRQGLSYNNTSFHSLLLSTLENRRLEQFVDSLQDVVTRYRLYTLLDKDWAKQSEVDHRRIVECLKMGRTEEAIKLLERHLTTARDLLTSKVSKPESEES